MNNSIPVLDKENITDEERKRLLNRQKCRNYRAKHSEHYRDYQRQYREANKTRPSVLHHRWKNEIIRLQATIAKWSVIHTSVGRSYTSNATAKIRDLQQRIAELNYTETNTRTSI